MLCCTLCDPMDCSPPGSSVHGILQARTLEWVATSFSNAWKWKAKVKLLSRVWLLTTPWIAAYQAEVGGYFILQGIFPTQGLDPYLLRLLHWQADSLPLSHRQVNVSMQDWEERLDHCRNTKLGVQDRGRCDSLQKMLMRCEYGPARILPPRT